MKPHWKRILLSALFALGVSLFTALYAWLVRPVLDGIFIEKNEKLLLVVPLAIIGTSLLKGICAYGQTYLMHDVGNRVIMDLRGKVYYHILQLPLDYHNRTSSGILMSNVMNDVGVLQGMLSVGIKDIFQQTLTIVALTAVIVYQNWKLAILALIVFPFAYYPLVRFGKKLREVSRTGQEKVADLTTVLQETLAGIRLIKAFGTERKEKERFEQKSFLFFRNIMKRVQIMEITSPLMELFGGIGIAFIIWYGGFQVIRGTTTPGTFFSFMTATLFMYTPVKNLSVTHNMFQQALASAERLFAILDEPTEFQRESGTLSLKKSDMSVEFRNVTFRYRESPVNALDGVTVCAKPGDIIALVGESGSGKSTLVNLIPRFYEPDQGAVLINGVNVKDLTLRSLREQIAIVSQETVLFDASVRENISYGLRSVGDDEIRAAARSAFADHFIQKLPRGYDTVIGERGVTLSGGERQRLAIARALLKNAPILILDEATSSLDAESEQMIQSALPQLMKNRTTFVIAHRLSTIQNATTILVMEKGRIVESGTHHELMSKNGIYRNFHGIQFNHPSP